MLFHITHAVRYAYNRRVNLGPHVLRVRPRADGTQRLIRFHLQVEPKPLGLPECIDLEGNAVSEPWFTGSTSSFAVITSIEVETLRTNPFDFIVAPGCRSLPLSYPPALRERLAPYTAAALGHGPVADLAAETARAAGGETV